MKKLYQTVTDEESRVDVGHLDEQHFKGVILKGNKSSHIKELEALFTAFKLKPGALQITGPPLPAQPSGTSSSAS